MHILVPQLILDKYKQGNHHGDFPAIGLFVDMSGFSTMTNDLVQYGQHGAEVLAIVMREAFLPLICSVYDHGGFISNFAGDAFTALFPVKNGDQSGVKNCIAAAWGIKRNMAETPVRSTPYGEFEITARVGIGTGSASWGIVTSEQKNRAAYYIRGSAIENCAESEKLASPGEILIDSDGYELTKNFIQVDQVDSHFKIVGFSEDVPECTDGEIPEQDLTYAKLFFPEELITQTPMGEFRQVVNMFISLPTVRTEEQLSILMKSLFALQQKYGGLLNRIDFGDKGSNILLFWGAPISYGNDIGRALNFILALQTETSIPIKVGITYRIAHAGFVGAPRREEYTCYGPGINLASRFMMEAPRGEVWVDEEIAKRVQHHFDIEYVEEITLKGFTEKQKVFVLHERRELFEALYKGELMGRDQEIDRLTQFVEPLWDGKYAGAMVISGDAGIGKSRLVHEFLENSEIMKQRDVRFALCHTDQVLRRSFNPFRYWLRRYFGVSNTQVESRNKRSFNQKLDRLISAIEDDFLSSELDRTRSFLGALVNLFWQDSLYEQLDPESRYENTLIGLITLVKGESLLQPLIIHLEDIQWIDEDSKTLLSQLHRAIISDQNRSFPIAILATSRLRDLEGSVGNVPFEHLPLGPLKDAEAIELAKPYLDAPVGSSMAEILISLGEGNPFFTEQLLVYMKENDLIIKEESDWQLRHVEKVPMPADVRALLIARIDQFPNQIKEIILTASALGREFDLQVLGKMVGDQNLRENLGFVEAGAVWVELTDGRYMFKNNLLRDAAYRMQIHTRRQELHVLALNALEQIYAEDLGSHYLELAYHAEQGSLHDKACRYLQDAGDLASESYNNDLAIDAFTRALKFIPEDALEMRFSVIKRREILYGLLGDRKAQVQDLEQEISMANQLGDPLFQAEAALRQVIFNLETSDYLKAIEIVKAAIAFAEEANAPEIVVKSKILWGSVLRMYGEYEDAREQLTFGRDLAGETGDTDGECSSLNNLGLLEIEVGNFPQAKKYLEEGYPIAQACGDLYFQAQILHNLAIVAARQGDFSSALDYYKRALGISQKIGSRMGEALQKENLGWLTGILGEYSSSRKYIEEGLQIFREIDYSVGEVSSLINLSQFSWAQKDFLAAREYSEEALGIARKKNYRPGEAYALLFIGRALSGLEKYKEAKSFYQQAIEIRRELDQQNLVYDPLAGLAELAFYEGNLLEAIDYVSEILKYMDEGGTLEGLEFPLLIYNHCFKVLQAGEHPRALELIERAYSLLQEQAEKIKDEDLRRSFIENVPWHAEIIQSYQNSGQVQ